MRMGPLRMWDLVGLDLFGREREKPPDLTGDVGCVSEMECSYSVLFGGSKRNSVRLGRSIRCGRW